LKRVSLERVGDEVDALEMDVDVSSGSSRSVVYGRAKSFPFIVDPESCFNGPIAILTGPKSVSAGDVIPYVISLYENVRSFGRATSGDFGSGDAVWDEEEEDLRFGSAWGIFTDASGDYLHRTEQTPDEEVWFTRDFVAAGCDDVVEKALEWIEGQL